MITCRLQISRPQNKPTIQTINTFRKTQPRRYYGCRLSAFTLIELLVVISVIAVVIAILLPSLSKARRAAEGAVCLSNLRTIGQEFEIYTHDSRGWLPPMFYEEINPTNGVTFQDGFFSEQLAAAMGSNDSLNEQIGVHRLRCPSRGDLAQVESLPPNTETIGTPFYCYAINYPLAAGIFGQPSLAPICMGYSSGDNPRTLRISQMPPSMFLLADCKGFEPRIYSPTHWKLDVDFDNDGQADTTSAGLSTNGRWTNYPYSGIAFCHARKTANFLFADGHCEARSVREWENNEGAMWGPSTQ